MTLVKQDFLTTLGNVMENEDFQKLYSEHFTNWGDIKAVVMLMKTYEVIDKKMFDKHGHKFSKEDLTDILRSLMKDSECRKLIVDSMQTFVEHNYNISARSLKDL